MSEASKRDWPTFINRMWLVLTPVWFVVFLFFAGPPVRGKWLGAVVVILGSWGVVLGMVHGIRWALQSTKQGGGG